jgi:hypothetical protein
MPKAGQCKRDTTPGAQQCPYQSRANALHTAGDAAGKGTSCRASRQAVLCREAWSAIAGQQRQAPCRIGLLVQVLPRHLTKFVPPLA